MKFKLMANVKFDADDIDDAFVRLAQHLLSLYLGDSDSTVFTGGYIDVRPVEEGDGDKD